MVFIQSQETQITVVKWTNAGGQTKRANERSFVYCPPAPQVDYGLGQKWFLPPSGLNGIRENLASYHSDNESGISLCRAIREGLPPFWNVHVQWMFCEETVLSIRLWSLQLPKTSNGKKVRQFFCCFKDSIENSDILTMQRVFNVALNQRY